ncbi:exopolysaccharide Pel transporter PelG [Rossellomorea vietnamensis]|nr:exopolysaccharide Pel transporter PelG [Rossellomorea vietnamensis]
MAGIGFHLQHLFSKETYSSKLKAYGFASLVTAGPWIIITAAIGLIQAVIGRFPAISSADKELFIFTVSYCFIFSQILFSTQQLTATRFVSDLIYEKKYNEIMPAFLGLTKTTSVLALCVWIPFALISPLPLLYKLVVLGLFLTVNQIWVLLLFLSAAKDYRTIGYGFLGGGAVAVFGTLLACLNQTALSFEAYSLPLILLLGFWVGMAVTLYTLFYTLLKTFPDWNTSGQFAYYSYFGKYPKLLAAGILYNLAIWVCTWIIWFGEGARVVEGSFLIHPYYDMAIFWSYLTILPTMVLFVVSIETRFYLKYKEYFNAVNHGGTLGQIKKAKEKMMTVLGQELQRVFRLQLIFTGVVVFFAGYIFEWLGLDQTFIQMFRITAMGALANGMLLILFLVMLYFDDQQGALNSAAMFFGINLVLTVLFLPGGLDWMGLSFCIGSFASSIYAAFRLTAYLKSLEYHTFCKPSPVKGVAEKRLEKLGRWLDGMDVRESR